MTQIKPFTFKLEKTVLSIPQSIKTFNSVTRTGCSLSA